MVPYDFYRLEQLSKLVKVSFVVYRCCGGSESRVPIIKSVISFQLKLEMWQHLSQHLSPQHLKPLIQGCPQFHPCAAEIRPSDPAGVRAEEREKKRKVVTSFLLPPVTETSCDVMKLLKLK